MTYVIDDMVFLGEDDGLALPDRRLVDGLFGLRLANFDRADPPPPYHAGGVPREAIFNKNVIKLPRGGGMPKIPVVCEVSGFDPAVTPIKWRLQASHSLGRYKVKSVMEKRPNKKPVKVHHARGKVVALRDEWQGSTNQSGFNLFSSRGDDGGHVAGGHVILSVAVRPPGASGWLQDFVHLRVIGVNPGETDVRAEVALMARGRNRNLAPMLNAIFAWEANFRQFRPTPMDGIHEFGLDWTWPKDPAWYPEAAFDFGVGISQFTHPDALTASIAWDWRDNMRAGANVFLDFLGSTYQPGIKWIDWATAAWSGYNGSSSYGAARKDSSDGQLVSTAPVPANFDVAAFTQDFALVAAPLPPPWPVPSLSDLHLPSISHQQLAQKIGKVLGSKVSNPDALSWAWPHIERQILDHDLKSGGQLPPGMTKSLVNEINATRSRAEVHGLLADAFQTAITATRGAAARNVPDYAAEWRMLSAQARRYVDGGFSAYPSIRGRLFAALDASNDIQTAIARINAYYDSLVAAAFPREKFDAPVHPELKRRLAAAADLLVERGAERTLDAVKTVGGVDIRNNVNRPSALSNHSFGWAVDFDAALNPNIKKAVLPLPLIRAFAGVDIYGAESVALRTPGPYDVMLTAVRTLSEASHVFQVAMSSTIGLHSAMGSAISRLTNVQPTPAQVDAVFTATIQNPPNQAGIIASLRAAGATAAAAPAAAGVLAAAAKLAAKAARTTKPTVTGTAASVARFGFLNLPPEFVAALISSQGGGLRWLGASTGTKDFMHFELFDADEPANISL